MSLRKRKKTKVTFAPLSRKKFRCNLCGQKISSTKTGGHRRTCPKLDQ